MSRRPAPDSERPLVNRSANPARLRERCLACTFELVTTRRRNARVRSAHPPRGDRPWSERDQSTFGDRPRPVRAYSARGALSACRVRPTEALDRPVELVEDVAVLCVKQLQHRATLPARPDQRGLVEAVHRGAWRDLPNATGRGRGRGRAARGGVRHRHPQGRAGRPARAHFVPGRQRLRLLITLHPTRQAAAPRNQSFRSRTCSRCRKVPYAAPLRRPCPRAGREVLAVRVRVRAAWPKGHPAHPTPHHDVHPPRKTGTAMSRNRQPTFPRSRRTG